MRIEAGARFDPREMQALKMETLEWNWAIAPIT